RSYAFPIWVAPGQTICVGVDRPALIMEQPLYLSTILIKGGVANPCATPVILHFVLVPSKLAGYQGLERLMNIVLCHGILGFNRISVLGAPIDYFNGVREFLEETFADLQVKVLVTQVNPVRGIHIRGDQLATQIRDALLDGSLNPDNKTHIIAHSMGG